jgi:hypothetical protein
MGYRVFGLTHAALHHVVKRLSAAGGQGTVEYVGLILLIAGVLAAVVTAGRGTDGASIAGKVTSELKQAIDSVGAGGSGVKG